MAEHGSIHWSELLTSDVEGAKAFYKTTAGWSFEAMAMPKSTYWICSAGGKPVAGIMDVAATDNPDAGSRWMTYVAVDDVDKAAEQATAGGGSVAHGPFDIPGVGRIAIVVDPAGAVVGMMTPSQG